MKKQRQKTKQGFARPLVAWLAALALTIGAAPMPAKATLPDALDMTVAIPPGGASISLPLSGTYTGVTIDWGDGTSSPGTSKTHLYATAGSFDIQVSAQATGTIGLGITGIGAGRAWTGSNLITRVSSWNNLSYLKGAFSGATSLQSVPNYLPPGVTTIASMFYGASSFNSDISAWDTSRILDMSSTFKGASAFNQNISGWNTSAVLNLQSAFEGASAFNQPIGGWDTRAVTSMASTFLNAAAFNQPLSQWDTSATTNMGFMFYGATSFNQPIGNWNVTRVTSFLSMFQNAAAFNQSLNGWNTANGVLYADMFQGATAFNQSLASLNLKSTFPASAVGTMLTNSGMSAANLSATLQGWARGWTVGATTYTVPRSVTTAWRLNYLGDAATLAAVSTLTTTYGWNLSAETSSRMVSYSISPGTGTAPATTAVAIANPFAVAQASGFSRPGYTFTSWTDGSNNYAAGANYPAGSTSVSLAAQWSANTLTVTLDARNGAPATTISTQTDAQISSAPAEPTRTGYTFAGWFTSTTGGSHISFPYSHGQTADFTIYAQLNGLPHTVTYAAGTGSGTVPTQANVSTDSRFAVATSTGLSRAGYSFAGWSDGSTTYQPGESYLMGLVDVTLTALWSANTLTVRFDPTNGSAVMDETVRTDESLGAPTAPTLAGYRFIGWYTSAVGGTEVSFPYLHGRTSNFTLYAHWSLIPTSQISFTLNGGTGEVPAPVVLAVGSRITFMGSMAISREGYEFKGWSDGTNFYAPDSQIVVGSTDITLAPQWRKLAEDTTAPAGGSATPAPVNPTPLPVSSVSVKLSLGSGKPTRIGQAALSEFLKALVGYPDLAKYRAKVSVAFGSADSHRSSSSRKALVTAALASLRAAAAKAGVQLAIDPSAPTTATTDRYSNLAIQLIPAAS